MLLYSVLHLAGVKRVDEAGDPTGELSINLEDIRAFRQLGSPCAGHPEYGEAAGIETTTGPLGQGIGNSVGMAAAAKWLAARYGESGLFEYNVYAFCSDGDLMEGVGCEAASLAGHQKLSNLCWIYDNNHITIEGDTDLAFTEDVAKRFQGLGWHTIEVDDANDLDRLGAAFESFAKNSDSPTIIVLRSIIGFGAPNKANTHGAHGSPLGAEEIELTKKVYGWPNEDFHVPAEVHDHFAAGIGQRGATQFADWTDRWNRYASENPAAAEELRSIWSRKLPADWAKAIPVFDADEKGMATRASSGKVLNAIGSQIPWLIGGSADLAPSNNTRLGFDGAGDFAAENYAGRNFHFGIREHGMAAYCNGLALSGIRPYCGTFFVFTDYLRPSMRLSSLMHQPVLYVLTHDSIGLGEDGPTHQPVEHLAACRAIPGLHVVRPADANEVATCYRKILAVTDHPAALVLSRQNLPTLDPVSQVTEGAEKGGYTLVGEQAEPQVILMATGSEVMIAVAAAKTLESSGVRARVVSMPCWEWFDDQPKSYRDAVLPPAISARVAIEAGIRQGWDKYLGAEGQFVGMSSFGASAPAQELYAKFGITAECVVDAAQQAMQS
jgi:transketolase